MTNKEEVDNLIDTFVNALQYHADGIADLNKEHMDCEETCFGHIAEERQIEKAREQIGESLRELIHSIIQEKLQ